MMSPHKHIGDCLSICDGRLWIEERDTLDLIREFGLHLEEENP